MQRRNTQTHQLELSAVDTQAKSLNALPVTEQISAVTIDQLAGVLNNATWNTQSMDQWAYLVSYDPKTGTMKQYVKLTESPAGALSSSLASST